VPFEADAAAAPGPLLVYFHGGGWVIGDIDTHDPLTRALAHSAGVRVLSVAYRLAPEHPFPAPVDDALAAFRDAVARAEELEVDARRVAVGGDSAGAHLATVTAQTTVRDGGPSPVFQLLIVPPTDLLHEHPSKRIFAEGFMHTRANGLWYEHHFIGDGDRSDPRASPLLAEDVGGVAPALIATAGFDPLRDEGEAYAAKLRAAGVPVVLWRHSGYVHSFMGMLGVGDGPRLAVATMGGVLRGALAE
jgi:acetyl esterase